MTPEIYFHVIYKSGLVRQVDIPKTKYFFFDLINRTINDLSANALVLTALWAGQGFRLIHFV
jgi:hypothetical protein